MESRLEYLFTRYFEKNYSQEEKAELIQLLEKPELESDAKEMIEKLLQQPTAETELDIETADSILQAILNSERSLKPARLVSIKRNWFKRIAVAASILLLLGGGYWIFESQKSKVKSQKEITVIHDVKAPSTNRAMITLANGQKGDAQVQVLGTHFNVNAYDDEDAIKVTLLEGSVEVTLRQAQGQKSKVKINPGEQTTLRQAQGDIRVLNSVDLDEVMAWRNGLFYFNHADLQTVMRQIARWYDVEVSYEGNIPPMEFGGKISRNSNASEVLRILELSKVHFRIEGKKVTVMP